MAYIYKIINLINGKLYIGKTSDSIEKRWKEHILDSQKERYEKRPLYDAFNKYGIKNFQIEEIEKVENDDIACKREQYWINKLRTYIGFNDCNGYNATLGGDSRRLYDYKEIAEKYLELQNQRETAKYFNCDIETVKKACNERNIQIISSQQISRNKQKKSVLMYDLQENFIQEFETMKDAAIWVIENKLTQSTKIDGVRSSIRKACNGQYQKAFNHIWKWK
jgi:group I intron endonuclease